MLENFEKNIGYIFKDKNLLKTALTHTSYAYEKRVQSNEKLEFLGDSILEFISSNYLYKNYINLNEVLSDGNQSLIEGSTADGIHMYDTYLKIWLDYLKTHYVEPDSTSGSTDSKGNTQGQTGSQESTESSTSAQPDGVNE